MPFGAKRMPERPEFLAARSPSHGKLGCDRPHRKKFLFADRVAWDAALSATRGTFRPTRFKFLRGLVKLRIGGFGLPPLVESHQRAGLAHVDCALFRRRNRPLGTAALDQGCFLCDPFGSSRHTSRSFALHWPLWRRAAFGPARKRRLRKTACRRFNRSRTIEVHNLDPRTRRRR